jgi:hypothetical protein
MGIMPAVVVTGARQTGKSTLAQHMAPPDRRFYSLDDLDVMEQAREISRTSRPSPRCRPFDASCVPRACGSVNL